MKIKLDYILIVLSCLCDAFKVNSNITFINLRNNKIGSNDEDIIILSKTLKENTTITELVLSNNMLEKLLVNY